MSDYTPIACAFYDVFEIAIMRKQRLTVEWHDDSGVRHRQQVIPEDLKILDGAEWLVAHDEHGTPMRLRLDRIETATP